MTLNVGQIQSNTPIKAIMLLSKISQAQLSL